MERKVLPSQQFFAEAQINFSGGTPYSAILTVFFGVQIGIECATSLEALKSPRKAW